MEPKVVLITGCSSGIGLATAVSLARDPGRKYLVYATMRNLEKRGDLEKEAETALNDTLFIRELDVTKQDTIVNVVAELKEKYDRIDIVFNNAGYHRMGIIESSPMQDIRDIMEVNFFGVVRVIRQVLPVMKKMKSGRIINMSSVGGLYGFTFTEGYVSSKFALEGLTESLAIELRPHGIWVSSIVAGPIKTNLVNLSELKLADDSVDDLTKAMYNGMIGQIRQLFSSSPSGELAGNIQSTDDLVTVFRRAVEDERPHVRYRCMDGFPFGGMKYDDEDGDEYVDAVLQLSQNASTAN